jgi:hypothetical protein
MTVLIGEDTSQEHLFLPLDCNAVLPAVVVVKATPRWQVGTNTDIEYIRQWTLPEIWQINHIEPLSRTERKAATVQLALYYSSEPISSNEQTNAAPKPPSSLGHSPLKVRSF